MYYCEPKWHHNNKVDANFLVLPATDEDKQSQGAHAACERHLVRAVKVMLDRGSKLVRVRPVSNRPEAPRSVTEEPLPEVTPAARTAKRAMGAGRRHHYEPSQFSTNREEATDTVPCAECGNPRGATIHFR